MKEWWTNNWDKVATALISVVVAGIIGFFSAINATEEKIGILEKQVAVLKQRVDDAAVELKTVVQHTIAINNLNNRFDSIKDRVDLAEIRTAAIKELIELQRQKTVNELAELLEKYRKTKPR